jgi:hypothetical protein
MEMTSDELANNQEMTLVIQKYLVAEIETYSELLKSLYKVKGKKNV